MDFQFNSQNSQQNSSVGSDRLQRAIERNRQKQMKRMYKDAVEIKAAESVGPAKVVPESWSSPRSKTASNQITDIVPTRRSVGKPEEFDFLDRPTSRTRSTRSSSVSYPVAKTTSRAVTKTTTKRATSRTSRKAESKLSEWGLKAGWVILGVLCLRLIFSNGGVIDYYNKKSLINNQISELDSIKVENKNILKDIDLLAHDRSFQKRMVREHLGFISSDEYLILFGSAPPTSAR